MSGQDEKWMAAALECAALGLGAVEPNPMVGAVIVRDGREIARGYHRRFGGPHAEIEAMRATTGNGDRHRERPRSQSPRSRCLSPFSDVLRGATMYVTLEPCCHHGKKTPPCTEAMIGSGISRVVVAMEDPDAHVCGRGVAALRAAGIEVTLGVRQNEARALLAAYITLRTQARPWVIAKWAQTSDGFLALPERQGRWISSQASRDHAHRVRGVCDGIMVGIGTVLADDPLLTNRSGQGRQGARVVLDGDLRLPLTSRLVQTARQWPLIVVVSPQALAANAAKADSLRQVGVELLPILPRGPYRLDWPPLLAEFGRRQWTRLLVEGGPTVLRDLLERGLADEVLAYVSPTIVGDTRQDLPHLDVAEIMNASKMNGDCPYLKEETQLGPDRVIRYRRRI